MRLFLAVKITEQIRAEIAEFVEQFLKFPGHVKWVEPHNLHLTLKFLGETDPAKLASVKQAALQAATGFGSFDITLTGCGAFPGLRNPRVFWIGIDDPKKRLPTLAARLDTNLSELGFEPEKRPFSPHLTLARVKEPGNLGALTAAFGDARFAPQPLTVDAVFLIESHLRPRGPEYVELARFAL